MAPLLEGLDEEQRSVAVEEGRRSLAERGYLDDGEPTGDLHAILTVRSVATAIGIADVIAPERRSLYLYGLAGAGFLVERVHAGVHAFELRGVESAAALLSDEADPDGRADDDGPLVHAQAGEPPAGLQEAERAVAAAERVFRLYLTRRSGPDEVQQFDVSVASGPAGVWFVSGHRDADGRGETWARRLGRASLEVAFASLLAGPEVARG